MYSLLAVTAAIASDLSPTLWHPAAEPMERGFGYVGTGAVISAGPDFAGTWLSVSGAWAPSRRLAFSGSALGAVGSGLIAGGARFNVVDAPWLHLAPVVYGAAFTFEEGGSAETVGVGAGLAAETGWTRVRFDTFVPLLMTASSEGPMNPARLLPGFDRLEMGMSVRVGADHHHRLRGAATPSAARISYQYVGDHWFLDTTLSLGAPVVSTWVRAGLTF